MAVLLAALVLASGCAAGQEGAGEGDTSPSSESTPPSGEGGTRPTDLPVDLRECPSGGKGDVPVPETVAGFTFSEPSGFTPTSGLGQVEAAEDGGHVDQYLMLDGAAGIEVLALVHYTSLTAPVTDGCGRLLVDEVRTRLADHNDRSGSTLTRKPEMTEIAGVPALVEERTYPNNGFEVRHHWIYARDDMLNIQCQWTTHRDAVLAGCEALLDSLTLP